MTEFICPTCGLQKEKELRAGWVVCPTCKEILALSGIIENPVHSDIDALKKSINDYGEKLFIARRDNLPSAIGIEEDLKEAIELLKSIEEN